MRRPGALVLAVLTILISSGPVLAAKRVALVIGNSAYENVARLGNPANDAAAMTTVLKEAGFDIVDSRRNLRIADMRRAFREFADKSRDADVAVVYYAGHGIEVDGANYLIPVDATLERDLDIYDEAFSLDRILITVEPARQLRLVMLDACRDNPFAKTMKRTIGSRSIGRGLAKVEPASPNTLIAFASKAGSTASDGDSKNSPFTSALVKHIATPGLDLRKAFGYVRDEVLKNTGNRQEPYVYGSLGGDDVPLVPASPAALASNSQADMRRDYELAERVGTKEVWIAFLTQYSEGLYATLAKSQLNKIASEEARIAATEKARLAQEEKARLAAEGAKQAEQAKAAAQAKATEEARLAAETAKQIEQAKMIAAEQALTAAKRAAAETPGLDKAPISNLPEQKAVVEARPGDANARRDPVLPPVESSTTKPDQSQVASLPAPPETTIPTQSTIQRGIVKELKKELQRVGCYTGAIDEKWATAKASLGKFVKFAKLSTSFEEPGLDLLEALRDRKERVCPQECSAREVESNGQCIARTCPEGSTLADDGSCEKRRSKSASHPAEASPDSSDKVKPTSRSTAAGDPVTESMAIMGPGTIRYGQTMTLTGRNGRKMTCTGGDTTRNVPRSCFWN